jgi:hypothetical protein
MCWRNDYMDTKEADCRDGEFHQSVRLVLQSSKKSQHLKNKNVAGHD